MTHWKQKLIALLTITALLLPSVTSAVNVLGETTYDNQPQQTFTAPQARQKTPMQRLEETRKDDYRQCTAEVTGAAPLDLGHALLDEPTDDLKNAVKEKVGEAMPRAVNNLAADRLPAAIQTGIRTEMAPMIKEGLARELPLTLGQKIQAEMAANSEISLTQMRDSGRFAGLVNESIRETLPNIIRDGLDDRLPNIIDTAIDVEIPNALRIELNRVAKPTIEDHFRAEITGLITQIPDMMIDEIENLQGTIQGTIAGIQASIQSFARSDPLTIVLNLGSVLFKLSESCKAGKCEFAESLLAIPQIAQMAALIENLQVQITATGEFIKWAETLLANKEVFIQNLIDGFAVSLSKSLTEPKAIARLADEISDAMTDPVNRAMDNAIGNIEASLEDPINRAIENINDLPGQFFRPIDAALNDISQLVDLEINMVVNAVTNPIISTIDVVSNELATNINQTLNGVLSPVIGEAGNILGSAGQTIANGMTGAALETHIAIFGGAGLFTNIDTGGQPLWPNGEATAGTGAILPQPSTYIPENLSPSDPFYGIANSPYSPQDNLPTEPFFTPGTQEVGYIPTPLTPEDPAFGGASPFSSQDLLPISSTVDEMSVGVAEEVTKPENVEGVVAGAAKGTSALSNLTDTFSGLGTSMVTGGISMIGGIVGGMIKTGNPYTDAIANVALQYAVKKGVELAAGAAGAGAAGAAVAVPVIEMGPLLLVNQSTDSTTSKILQTSQEIKGMTEKLLQVQIEACTHLKVVQRVQLALETKELVNDPNVRKANAVAIYKAELAFKEKYITQGRAVSEALTGVNGNNQGPLIIRNLTAHQNDAGREEEMVLDADLAELAKDTENYPNLEVVRASLDAQNNQSLASAVGGSLTKTEIDAFRNNPQDLPNDKYWDTLIKLGRPENNVYGQTLIAQGIRDQRVAAAKSAARDEYIAGGGWASSRECPPEFQTTDPKTGQAICREWQALTPPSSVGSYANRLAQAPIEQAAAADELIEDSPTSDVAMAGQRIVDIGNLDLAKQGSFNSQDPCPGPQPCSSSAQSGWPRPPRTLPTLPTLPVIPPTPPPPNGIFNFTTPSLAEVNAGAENETVLTWQMANAGVCTAKNDWPSSNVGSNVKNKGNNLNFAGSVTINHPVKFPGGLYPTMSRVSSPTGLTGPIYLMPNLAGDKTRDRIIFNATTITPIHSDDVYRFTIPTRNGSFPLTVGGPGMITPATPAGLIAAFKTKIEGEQESLSPLGNELRKYTFSFVPGSHFTMAPKLVYQMTCTSDTDQAPVDKTVIICREGGGVCPTQ